MIGIDAAVPTVIAFSPLLGILGHVLLTMTIVLGVLVLVSHVVTRIIKLFL